MHNSTSKSSASRVRRLVFAVLAVAAIVLAGRDIARQWQSFANSGQHLVFDWPRVAGSAAIVLLAYGVLIETWRRVVTSWGGNISFVDASRIWFVSNLGRYIPGRIWQIAAMGSMATDAGVSPVAATGSAIVVNLVNLLAGLGVVLASGVALFENRVASLLFAATLLVGIVVVPLLLPLGARIASKVLGRRIEVPTLPKSSLWLASVGCTIAWVLYGIAFRMLVGGVLGSAPGSVASYIAAFTGSYLLGYIALFTPGGLGVREGALIVSLQRLGIGGGAGIIAVASRLWLTALEVVPGVLFLVAGAMRRRRLHDVTR